MDGPVEGLEPTGPVSETSYATSKAVTTTDGFDADGSALLVPATDSTGEQVSSSLDDMSASTARL